MSRPVHVPGAWQFDLCAGKLCLDFANAVSRRGLPDPVDRLAAYVDLAEFARQTGLVSAAEARRLVAEAARRPVEAARVLERARAFREALYRLFRAVAEGRPPAAEDVASLNEELARGLARRRLARRGDGGWAWEWPRDPRALDAPLGPVAESAATLLLEAPESLRICEADDCFWIFHDGSKNRSRRWCDMKQCGNRMKARRHYERKRGEARVG